jgi:hypothetical protein
VLPRAAADVIAAELAVVGCLGTSEELMALFQR